MLHHTYVYALQHQINLTRVTVG